VPEPPGYEVETRPVAGPRRHLLVPIAVALAIGVVAIAGNLLTSIPPPIAQVTAAPSPSASAPSLPLHVDCGAMRAYDCSEAVDAARLAIADQHAAIDTARAWPTLICGDNFDCPPPLLAASDPVGSVALTLLDRDVVWINVFRVYAPNRLDDNREVLETRVVRWFPAPA
jgi:hypothetical protein